MQKVSGSLLAWASRQEPPSLSSTLPTRSQDPPPAEANIDDGVDYLEDAAAYLKEQAEYLSKEAQKTIKRTKGQVDDVVDKATGVATGAVKSVQSLM